MSRRLSLMTALPVLVCTLATNALAQTVTDPSLAVDVVAQGLSSPTTMAFLGPGDILVLEKNTGKVRRVINGVLQAGSVLDVPVNSDSERGLLGIAINGQSPPRVFLYYTENPASAGDNNTSTPLGNRIYRYIWNGSTLDSQKLILNLPALPGPNHNGGFLLLGSPEPGLAGDGRPLYAVIGDLNRDNQLENFGGSAAPDNTAVILRIQQDDSASPDPLNPFFPYCSASTGTTCTSNANCPAGQTCLTQVARYYAYGVRNAFGLAIDPVFNVLWDTENGPDNMDEINRVEPGFNSGWEKIMGPDSRDPQDQSSLFHMPGGQSAYSDPEFSWLDTVAPTGIVFPIGSALGADYDATVLVGDVTLGNLYKLPLNATRTGFVLGGNLADLVADNQTEANQLRIGSGFAGITDLKIGPDGNLYLVSIGGGKIYRIRRAGPPQTPTIGPTRTPTRTPSPTPTPTPTPTRPPNDAIEGAIDMGGVNFTATQSTASATSATSDRSTCAAGKNSHSVWYRFTAAGAVNVRAETTGSSYDTVLAVWKGSPGQLSLVGCNNNDGSGAKSSKVDFKTLTGTTYFLEAMSRATTPGGSLRIQLKPTCFNAVATIVGTEGSDLIDGTSGNDVIVGFGGNDTIRGLAGNDLLCGDDGNDRLEGGDGNDKIRGGNGDDTLLGEAGNDSLNGESGKDVCQGGTGANSVASCP
jgi:glucose/arabinose dehydrogenase